MSIDFFQYDLSKPFVKENIDLWIDRAVLHFLLDEKEGILSYKMDDLLTLEEVLEQHSFEEQEGYYFLRQLFEDLIAANRNKTILMDPEYVFVGVYGDVFRFIALPIDSLDKPLETPNIQ